MINDLEALKKKKKKREKMTGAKGIHLVST